MVHFSKLELKLALRCRFNFHGLVFKLREKVAVLISFSNLPLPLSLQLVSFTVQVGVNFLGG